jgi:beta-lactam-binding protein with PASTA domain
VKLLVSKGPPGVKVPNVVGLAAADALKRLQASRLAATLTQTASAQAPGTVLAQRPEAGGRAKPGTKVVLEVAKGRASVSVPNVVGRSQQDAAAALQQAGLRARAVQVPSSQAKGTVIAESPAAGRKVAQGSTVRLNVSRGRPSATTTTTATTTARATTTTATTTTVRTTTTTAKSTTPYSGMSLNVAVQKIAQGSQQALVVYVASTIPGGTVVSSSTAGSRVRLNVSDGRRLPSATSVPDVTGEGKTQATSDLQAAGFRVLTVKWPVSDDTSDGVVVAQTPASRAPRGAAIVIYVGTISG